MGFEVRVQSPASGGTRFKRQHTATASASPSYRSEDAVTAAAAAAVLDHLFPDQTVAVDGMADQAGWSRIIAGVAFLAANDE